MTSARFLRLAVILLAVGLVFHNLAMSLLFGAGLEGAALDVVAAWKDVLLLVALGIAFVGSRSVPHRLWADRLALAYTAIVLLYWLVPQSWLDGEATARGELYALRHHLLPVAAYLLGRLIVIDRVWWRRIAFVLLGTAVAVAAWGLIDVYLVPLQWWRDSGVPGWFAEQLGLDYACFGGLPENWIYNTGDESNPIRRLVSTFLSPLASAYVLVVVLLLVAAAPRRRLTLAVGVFAYLGLLATHTRAALIALTLGLIVLAVIKRRWEPAVLGIGSLVVSAAVVAAFPTIGPSTSYTASELSCLRANAAQEAEAQEGDALTGGDSSTRSHLRSLRDGLRTVLEHPQGYGLGNAGVSASRTGADIKAGESTYTEAGVDTGLLGMVVLAAWFAALIAALWRRSAWLAASMTAVAFVGLQTDVIGVHWIAVVVFALAGAALRRPGGSAPEEVEL
jgi:O-Antigen ligase